MATRKRGWDCYRVERMEQRAQTLITSAMTLWSSDSVLTFETKYLYVMSLILCAIFLVKYF